MSDSSSKAAPRLVVDPLSCGGIGVCAHLAPGVVGLDRWGYPVMPTEALTKGETRRAQRAVTGCPRQALLLTTDRRS